MTADRSLSLVRRAAVLLLLTAGIVLGAALPSWASFTDVVSLPQMTVATPTVAVPGIPTAIATCGAKNATVTVNWKASTAPRVSGYQVRVWLDGAWQDQAPVTGTTWTGGISPSVFTSFVVTFTVWTQTPYGWTAESAHTAQVLCS